jgi:hypothetical protein
VPTAVLQRILGNLPANVIQNKPSTAECRMTSTDPSSS